MQCEDNKFSEGGISDSEHALPYKRSGLNNQQFPAQVNWFNLLAKTAFSKWTVESSLSPNE